MQYKGFPICPYYAIRAYFCNDSVAKRRGYQDFVPYAGAFFLWLYAGHLHSRHHKDAGGSGGEDGQFYVDDAVDFFSRSNLPNAQKASNTSSSVYPLMCQIMGHLMGQKIVPRKKSCKKPLKPLDFSGILVRVAGFEPTASWTRTTRQNSNTSNPL